MRGNQARAVAALACAVALAACGGSPGDASAAGQATAAATATAMLPDVDACSLLTDAEVHALAPNLSGGRPGRVKIPNVSTCQWEDANGMPGLILQVSPADPSGVKAGLEAQVAPTGYAITAVPGLGDEAAVATQQPDPAHGLTAAVALLEVRVGKRQLGLSPVTLKIAGPEAPGFAELRNAAEAAVGRLRAAGG